MTAPRAAAVGSSLPRDTSAPEALICDVQRFSVHDGPGIRTTVFFKGCSLACRWCHNPETISFRNQPIYSASDCIGCGECVAVCPAGALRIGPHGVETDYRHCRACLRCTEVCPSEARRPAAVAYDADALLAEVLRDRDFFGADGGVTLSGGEPLLQAAFLGRFLAAAKGAGLHITVGTAGHWPFEPVRPLLGSIDLFLFDLKVIDPARHRSLTGCGNELILANLRRLVASGAALDVRMPLVPGLNTDAENLRATAELLTSLGLRSITLLDYHPLGQSKLAKLQTPLAPLEIGGLSAAEAGRARATFETRGIAVARA